jgi:hypothetical protein
VALQLVGVLSAIGIVSAFAALQFDLVGPHDLRYLAANLVCAGGLATVAVLNSQYGFIISNGFWTLVAAVSIVRVARSRRAQARRRGSGQ